MKRDFSEAAQKQVLMYVEEVSPETTVGKIIDSISDVLLYVKHLFTKSSAVTSQEKLNKYLKEVVDKRDFWAERINDIFTMAREKDEQYAVKGAKVSDSGMQLLRELNLLIEMTIAIVEVQVTHYSAGVSRGSIRYCNQNPAYWSENGWSTTHRYSSGGMCNRACESMALSYLGIDQSPSSMHDTALKKLEFAASGVIDGYRTDIPATDGTATVEVSGGYYKGRFDRNALNELVQRYEDDKGAGVHSPVLLHYDKVTNQNYVSHWILLIKSNGDGSYQAIGPWSNNGEDYERPEFTVWIDDNGVVSGNGFSGCNEGRSVSHIGQYSRVE